MARFHIICLLFTYGLEAQVLTNTKANYLSKSFIDEQVDSRFLTLPVSDDETIVYRIVENNVLSPKLKESYSELSTFDLVDITSDLVRAKLTIDGQRTLIVGKGKRGLFTINESGEIPEKYIVFYGEDPELKRQDHAFNESCSLIKSLEPPKDISTSLIQSRSSTFSNGSHRDTFDLAIVTTGEFGAEHGGGSMGVIVNTVQGWNLIYEAEVSATFVLALVQINSVPASDPFTPDRSGGDSRTNQAAEGVEFYFPNASNDYDIGHVFHSSGDTLWSTGGVAQISAVCETDSAFTTGDMDALTGPRKAGGWSGSFNNLSNGWIQLSAHEIGHMFSASHTFNGIGQNCDTFNLSLNTAYEIGSGTTIMSYSGICMASQNVPESGATDNYFHANSLDQIISFINFISCQDGSTTINAIPVANASPNLSTYTIPISTPFEIEGSGSDTDGDALTYTWEQLDEDGDSVRPTHGFTGATAAASSIAPLFRSYPPSSSPIRVFPALTNILAGTNTGITFEALPSVARSMDFALTVRDQVGGAACDLITINSVNTGGAFAVTSQNSTATLAHDGTTTFTITWNVAGTTGGGVNCANVDILMSIDGGQSYPQTLVSATTNDGTEAILIPNLPTTTARFKVKCSDNIFFDINNADVTITSSCKANGASFTPLSNVSAEVGSPSLDLALSNSLGSIVTSFSADIQNDDLSTNLAVDYLSMSSCISFSNNPHYELFSFQVDVSGMYTFSKSSGTLPGGIMNLYETSYNDNDVCTNWLASNGNFNDTLVIISSNVAANLSVNTTYLMVVSGFRDTDFGTLNIAMSGLGNVYDGPIPPAGFSYTYVIVNESTDNIVGFDTSADLSDDAAGSYTIYGLSYDTMINLVTYVGGSLSTFTSDMLDGTICANRSFDNISVTITSLLPVELLSFIATKQGLEALLSWITASEVNNAYFEVERQTEQGDFESIGRVNGIGTTSSLQEYIFVYTQPLTGLNAYRLRQVDVNGDHQYSQIQIVRFDEGLESIQVFPNPVKGQLSISGFNDLREVIIYDVKGNLVKHVQSDISKRDVQVIDMSHVDSGVYFVRLRSLDHSFVTRRIIKE